MDEKEILENLRKGELSAYEYLYSEYYQWLCNYVFKLSGDSNLSEDIVQETLLGLWEKRRTLFITTSLKSYLFKCCHNHFLLHLRKEKKKKDVLDNIRLNTIFETYINYQEETQPEEKLLKLHSLIDKLPPRCKEIFIKNKLEKVKYREIAEELDISIKTVESQMSKALHFLRENAHLFML
jgi:RNA polymerase sigma-70 factor (ECF subfamily)